MNAETTTNDVLYGMPAVAQAFGWRTRQAESLEEKHGLPTFKIGRIFCARRRAVAAWLAAREADAQSVGAGRARGAARRALVRAGGGATIN